ncbi:MAG: hypothetical protein WDZ88_02420 [Candidatus Paceibacterota bacterium]
MKIERIHQNGTDSYWFKIDDLIVLEISGTAISQLKIALPLSGTMDDYYTVIEKQFDIQKMVADVLNNNTAQNIVIDSETCKVDEKIVFQIEELKRYINSV